MMHSYTVTIGRNVGTAPMSDISWHVFAIDVLDLLETIAAELKETPIIEKHTGEGVWNGTGEDSEKFTMLTNDIMPSHLISGLANHLSSLAAEYKQDAIALTIGTSILCQPVKVA